MIYVIIGPSCGGKSTLVMNSFIRGRECREFRDLLTVCETDTTFLIGKWFVEQRVKGLDRISRAEIPKIADQVKRLIPKGKDIVLEGDKAASRNLLRELLDTGEKCQLIWVRCSVETTLARNKKNGSIQQISSIKAVASKARNIFRDFAEVMNGGVIDTDNVMDWENFSLQSQSVQYPFLGSRENERDDFAVFILTHGRADNVVTYSTLRRCGYIGKIYMIIDDEDGMADDYRERFGSENVIQFCKRDAVANTDTGDNFDNHSAIIYARNESYRIAKALGLTYFLMLDDDYKSFSYRHSDGEALRSVNIEKDGELNKIFDAMIEFLDFSGAMTVAFAQNGDFVGGKDGGTFDKGLLRKAMNSFFCKVDREIEFRGTMNEDVTTYTTLGSRGKLFFSYTGVSVGQLSTQSLAGGMTEAYKDSGTYMKSFYSVISMPSCVKVGLMQTKNARIHHRVNWESCVPKILDEKHRKDIDDDARDNW